MDEMKLAAAVAAYDKHKSQRRAAEELGVAQSTLNAWLKKASEAGSMGTLPVLPGFRLDRTTTVYDASGSVTKEYVTQKRGEIAPEPYELPATQRIERMSTLIDGDGRKVLQWIKSKEDVEPADLAAILKASFDDVAPRAYIPIASADEEINRDFLTLLPLADLHVGLFSWHRETGTNWDLDIAEEKLGDAILEAVKRSPASGHGVVLGGGDLLHSDTNENKTARSGNALDVDGRHQKVLMVANRLMVLAVELMLMRHERVTVRILPGNHDEYSSVAVAYYLHAYFRENPRVLVDIDPSLFWWFQWGRVALGATHGHTVKLKDMPGIMAHRKAKLWGDTEFRYIHGFHIHHKSVLASEGMGCICESHQTPTPQDAWHYGAGFLSGRSMQAITYHREFGEFGRVRVAVLDA
ncbi:hypothetical protein [Rhizobium phage RHph_X2_26]|nr:hypothetical protein [Rhizobium phage RHph_X2_26]